MENELIEQAARQRADLETRMHRLNLALAFLAGILVGVVFCLVAVAL